MDANEVPPGGPVGAGPPLVVFAGNIAVGKSTMAATVASELNAATYLESVSDNPFLERYYADMQTWTFHLNMYFLAHRAQQIVAAASRGQTAVLDRSFYEDRLFVAQAHDAGRSADDTYAVFCQLDRVLDALLPRPAVLVYLEAPIDILLQRIQQRARPFEAGITEAFLADLQARYDAWIASYDYSPVIRLDTAASDPSAEPVVRSELIADILRSLGRR
jgi:deoxyadenosine/deoxycytidine kinase